MKRRLDGSGTPRRLIEMLRQLEDGCRTQENGERWTRWFGRARKDLEAALERRDREAVAAACADLRRALWGGMGAFCDGGAPTPELEALGRSTYGLISSIEIA
jgi:hypothetical protein